MPLILSVLSVFLKMEILPIFFEVDSLCGFMSFWTMASWKRYNCLISHFNFSNDCNCNLKIKFGQAPSLFVLASIKNDWKWTCFELSKLSMAT